MVLRSLKSEYSQNKQIKGNGEMENEKGFTWTRVVVESAFIFVFAMAAIIVTVLVTIPKVFFTNF
jgi:hypothetical protein